MLESHQASPMLSICPERMGDRRSLRGGPSYQLSERVTETGLLPASETMTTSPALTVRSTEMSSSIVLTVTPLTAVITSSAAIPAASAGDPGDTVPTDTPTGAKPPSPVSLYSVIPVMPSSACEADPCLLYT